MSGQLQYEQVEAEEMLELETEDALPSHGEAFDDDPDYPEQFAKFRDLHPWAQILTLRDIDSCVALENATFPPQQRSTPEKVGYRVESLEEAAIALLRGLVSRKTSATSQLPGTDARRVPEIIALDFRYRLSKASELCFGLFTSQGPGSPEQEAATSAAAKAPDSSDPSRKGVLLAHLIATKTVNDVIHDSDMEVPPDWEHAPSKSNIGHQDHGRTLAIHSLAVLPNYQRRGLGTTLMKAYVQRMVESECADKIVLFTYDRLIPYYKNLGFEYVGKSVSQFGGENWNNMVLDFAEIKLKLNDDSE